MVGWRLIVSSPFCDDAMMKRLDELRVYYNHTIHPELLRMERRRRRLLRLLFFSFLLLLGLGAFALYVGLWVISLALMIPLGLYLAFLLYRVRRFVLTFKPRVMNLLLDFIDDGPNRGTLTYEAKGRLAREAFFESRLFETPAEYYEGEDYIRGKVGEMPFEMCELDVREISPVRTRLDQVFRGIFLFATFPEEAEGSLMIWPRRQQTALTRSIREVTFHGGVNVDQEILNAPFREQFISYAMPDTYVAGLLTPGMQEAVVEHIAQTGKEMYLSFQDRKIFLAIAEPRDLLEPSLWQSNLSFHLVRSFFEDINLMLRLVEAFDQAH